MKLPLQTESLDRRAVANRQVGDGVMAQGCNPFTCGALAITCATACADTLGVACIACLGSAYDACKDCF
jgi:hypothetical protein